MSELTDLAERVEGIERTAAELGIVLPRPDDQGR